MDQPELFNNVQRALQDVYPDSWGEVPVTIGHDGNFIWVEHPNGATSFLFADMSSQRIKSVLERDRDQDIRSEEPSSSEGDLGELSFSPEDREVLDFAHQLKREIDTYRNVGAFLLGLLVLFLPSIINWTATQSTNQATQATIEWYKDIEERTIRLEQAANYKALEKELNFVHLKNTALEKRISELESVQKGK